MGGPQNCSHLRFFPIRKLLKDNLEKEQLSQCVKCPYLEQKSKLINNLSLDFTAKFDKPPEASHSRCCASFWLKSFFGKNSKSLDILTQTIKFLTKEVFIKNLILRQKCDF